MKWATAVAGESKMQPKTVNIGLTHLGAEEALAQSDTKYCGVSNSSGRL